MKPGLCSLPIWDVTKAFWTRNFEFRKRVVEANRRSTVWPIPGGGRDSNARGGLELYGQANKRKRWMPWQSEAMKDVAACEKRGGAGNEH